MICDDQQDILRTIPLYFRKEYEFLTAKSGKECLSIYFAELDKNRRIDLIMLDYKLGDMSAEEVATKIKEHNWRTKILLITAYELDDDRVSKLVQSKLVDFELKKPFALEELKKKLIQILGS